MWGSSPDHMGSCLTLSKLSTRLGRAAALGDLAHMPGYFWRGWQEGCQALVGKKGEPQVGGRVPLCCQGSPEERRPGGAELSPWARVTVHTTGTKGAQLESWVGGASLARCAPSPGPKQVAELAHPPAYPLA